MYSGSVYGALASLLNNVESADLQDKRIAMYSYGSGLAATFFSIKVKGSTEEIKKNLQLNERLEKNQVRSCEEFLKALEVRSIFPLFII